MKRRQFQMLYLWPFEMFYSQNKVADQIVADDIRHQAESLTGIVKQSITFSQFDASPKTQLKGSPMMLMRITGTAEFIPDDTTRRRFSVVRTN
jgi:hypothetical protein